MCKVEVVMFCVFWGFEMIEIVKMFDVFELMVC